jgi:hypothetical protein
MIGAVTMNDPAWLREHLVQRMDMLIAALFRFPHEQNVADPNERARWIDNLGSYVLDHPLDPAALNAMLHGLQQMPEGEAWLSTHQDFLHGLSRACRKALLLDAPSPSSGHPMADWQSLNASLGSLGITHQSDDRIPPPSDR